MGTDRADKWRSAELVLTSSTRGVVGALFAVEHVRGNQGRRLLARELLVGPAEATTVDGLLDQFALALEQLRKNQFTPPR